jgi:hypothetical protein
MQEIDMNNREVAMALDIPEQRVRDLRAGWLTGVTNAGIVPSFITRYAMVALLHDLRPVRTNPECYDLVVRLGQAAFDAGLEPWPAGELKLVNPRKKRPGEARKAWEAKMAAEAAKKKEPRKLKRVLVPKDPTYR